MRPDFLGLGVHKGGSSWIYLALYEHPALCVPVKDLHFFSVDRMWRRGRSWYEDLFRQSPHDLVCGEFSNTYFPSPSAPQRIHAFYSDVKLFVCLRNPVERAFSHYLQDLKMGHIAPGTPFETALDVHPEYLEWGQYAQHLERYLDLFSRDQLLVLLFDDLVDNPAGFVRTLYQFLGADGDFVPSVLGQRVNVARLPRWPVLDRFTRHSAGLLRQTKAGAWLWWQVKKTGWPDRINRWNAARTPMPTLSAEMRDQLQTFFAADNRYVRSLLDRPNLNW